MVGGEERGREGLKKGWVDGKVEAGREEKVLSMLTGSADGGHRQGE